MWGFKIYPKYERRCLEKVRTLWWHFACNRYKYFEFDYLIFIVDLIVLLSRAILQIFSILFLLYFSLSYNCNNPQRITLYNNYTTKGPKNYQTKLDPPFHSTLYPSLSASFIPPQYSSLFSLSDARSLSSYINCLSLFLSVHLISRRRAVYSPAREFLSLSL